MTTLPPPGCAVHAVFGLNAAAYHAINVVCHSVNTMLVYLMLLDALKMLGHVGAREVATAAGCLFAVHPVHTEAVAALIGLADLLAALAVLGGLQLYKKALRARASGAPSASLCAVSSILCCALGLLCKETAIVGPLLFAAYDGLVVHPAAVRQLWWSFCNALGVSASRLGSSRPSPRSGVRDLVTRWAALVMVLMVLIAFRLGISSSDETRASASSNPALHLPSFSSRVLTKVMYNMQHLGMMIFPTHMSCDYSGKSLRVITEWGDLRNQHSLFGVTMLTIGILGGIGMFLRQGQAGVQAFGSVLLLGVALLLVPLLLASHFALDVAFVLAQRLLYPSSIGACLLLAALPWQILVGFAASERRRPPHPAAEELHVRREGAAHDHLQRGTPSQNRQYAWQAIMVSLIVAYAFRAVSWSAHWRTEELLYSTSLQTVPHNAKLHHNLALVLGKAETERKLQHFRLAVGLAPTSAKYHRNYGAALHAEGRWAGALAVFRAGLGPGLRNNLNPEGGPSDQAAMAQYAAAILLICREYQSAAHLINLAHAAAPHHEPIERLQQAIYSAVSDPQYRKQLEVDLQSERAKCSDETARAARGDWSIVRVHGTR